MRIIKNDNVRWVVLSLLFIATAILYIDRSALGILAPELQKAIGWSEQQYGLINTSFMVAYAVCFLFMGRIIDSIGTKKGYALSIGIWSIAAVGHVLARSWVGFAVARFSLAIGQSGNFPSAIKTVSQWFPKKERALAVSLFNGGANVGTIIAPLVIPPLVIAANNWRIGFLWTFPISIIWLVLWFKYMRKPQETVIKKDNDKSVQTVEKITWRQILSKKGTWVIALAKFMSDPIWWFYLFWGAKFLYTKYDVNLKDIGLPFFTIYLLSWIVGIFLGWLSSRFLKRGMGLNKGRKLALLASALFAIPVVFVPYAESLYTAVFLIAMAAGGHCGWSANIFSLMSDMFPNEATASITGLGGFAGAIGGALAAFFVGHALQNIGVDGYNIPFLFAGLGYLIALAVMHIMLPKFKLINFSK